jgi:excisionase family DNA binding protein
VSSIAADLELLTPEEVAGRLRLGSAETVRRMAREGRLPHVKIARRVLFDWDEVAKVVRDAAKRGVAL